MNQSKDTDYKLIPMSEITDEAREIAKRWYDGVSEMNDIREKHKLASDIMNYARRHAPAPDNEQEVGKIEKAAELLTRAYQLHPLREGQNILEAGMTFDEACKLFSDIKTFLQSLK